MQRSVDLVTGQPGLLTRANKWEPRNAAPTRFEVEALLRDMGANLGASDHNRADEETGARYMPFDTPQIAKLHEDYRDDLHWLTAGAEGLAQYRNPIGDTSDGANDRQGSQHDRCQENMVRTG